MPVTHGVAGSSPVRTANNKQKEKEISPFFITIVYIMFYTYILYSAKIDKLYFGYTNDVSMRLQRHNSGSVTSTSRGVPWELLFYSCFDHQQKAMKEERVWKNLKSRKRVLSRIEKKVKQLENNHNQCILMNHYLINCLYYQLMNSPVPKNHKPESFLFLFFD
jgi:putative endonuclease